MCYPGFAYSERVRHVRLLLFLFLFTLPFWSPASALPLHVFVLESQDGIAGRDPKKRKNSPLPARNVEGEARECHHVMSCPH